MNARFEVVVIGTGATGQTAAVRCAAAGRKVLITDELPYGGTCALRGCDPKKILVAAAEAIDWTRRMRGSGVRSESVEIDWAELQRFKRSFTDPVPEKSERRLQKAGVETRHARARFKGPGTLDLEGIEVRADQIVIATGAEPFPFPFEGASHLMTSTDFLDVESLPRDVTFVGGGFISFEFAHVAARAGSRVRILEMAQRPLGPFEPELVETLVEATRSLGIEILTETKVVGVSSRGDGFDVAIEGPEGSATVPTELVVHGGGRVARIDPLDLEAGGVEATPRGITVDRTLRSVSNSAVWAGGDAADAGIPLTPVAVAHGHIIGSNIVKEGAREATHEVIPSVVFTIPPLARVGLSEKDARDSGVEIEVQMQQTSGWFSSRRIGEDAAMHKVLVERATGRIVGAHLLGHGSEELINLFALAMQSGIPAGELKQVMWAYPTKGSDLPYMV
ncbi:MAG: NAD(P)/FAD-dependent oxidoreductase [Acidobacteria bacterium]|nr:NAD(P)/FAD-dependent oxidoreductase [Acidobacteriota bacterium]